MKKNADSNIKEKLKITVVIPVYNRTHELTRAIRSVLNQTYQDFEILVVDDCSTKDIKPTIDKFQDDRIHFIRHQINKKAGAARNTGAKAAKGEFIAFLDSDDEWLPDHLSRRMELICSTQADGIYGSVIIQKENERNFPPPARQVENTEHMLDYLLSNTCRASTPTLFIKKEKILSILFDETLAQNQDYDFNIRFSQKFKYVCDPEPTVIVHVSGDDRMGKNIAHDSCFRFIDKHRKDISKETYLKYLFSLLYTTIQNEGRSTNAFRYLFRIFAAIPGMHFLLKAVHVVVPIKHLWRRKRGYGA